MKLGRLPFRRQFGFKLAVLIASHLPAVCCAHVLLAGEADGARVDPATGITPADRPDFASPIAGGLNVSCDHGQVVPGAIHADIVRDITSEMPDIYDQRSRTLDISNASGFEDFATDVDFRTDIGSGAPSVRRSDDGKTLDLALVNNAGPMFVRPNASTFDLAGKVESAEDNNDSSLTATTAYAPASTVIPLPPALFSAPIGFVLAVLGKRLLRR